MCLENTQYYPLLLSLSDHPPACTQSDREEMLDALLRLEESEFYLDSC